MVSDLFDMERENRMERGMWCQEPAGVLARGSRDDHDALESDFRTSCDCDK